MARITSDKILKIIMVILICIRALFFLLNTYYNMYFLVANINQSVINSIIYISIIIIIALLLDNKVNKICKYLLNIFKVVSILIIIAYCILSGGQCYFYFEAPDKSKTLIVEEDSFLLAGWSHFYERESIIFAKDLKSEILTDDGYRPLSANHYHLKWLDNTTIELQYDFGSGEKQYHKETIKMN